MAVEDGEAEEVSSTLSQPPELQEPKASSSTSTVRKFCPAWKNVYPWVQYDEEEGMSCSICVTDTKRTMHLPREQITFDRLRLSDTWLTTIMLTP